MADIKFHGKCFDDVVITIIGVAMRSVWFSFAWLAGWSVCWLSIGEILRQCDNPNTTQKLDAGVKH